MHLIRGQGCLFLSCFSEHRKANILTTHGDIHTWLLQQTAALCGVAGNRSLAILFSSTWQICHPPDGSKGRSVGHQPAVTFCLVTSQDQGSYVSTVATHQHCAIPARQLHRVLSRTTSATKGLCSSLGGGTHFNLFSLIPSTNGFNCFTHHFLQQKNHNSS